MNQTGEMQRVLLRMELGSRSGGLWEAGGETEGARTRAGFGQGLRGQDRTSCAQQLFRIPPRCEEDEGARAWIQSV